MAELEVVLVLHQVEMDVLLMIAVRAWPEHRDKARAYRMQHGLAGLARHGTVGERDRAAVGELEGAHVEGIGAAVLGQMRAGDAIETAAFIRIIIVERSDLAAELLR